MSSDSLKLINDILEKSVGDIGTKLYQKSVTKLSIGDNPSSNDIEKLVMELQSAIAKLYGNDRSKVIFDDIRKKLGEKQKSAEAVISSDIDKEINDFLGKHTLPTEGDITDYAKYLTMKFGGNAQKLEKDIIEKIKIQVKTAISRKKINQEIGNFLLRYPQPEQKDIDDFINYIRLSKLNFQENELREIIEKERLYRKFHGDQIEVEAPSELDQFIEVFKTHDKTDISKTMHKQEISYLIKDESGVSDKLVSEFVELMTPSENDMKDTLEGLGLEHLIKNK
jgi:hypothetical protein